MISKLCNIKNPWPVGLVIFFTFFTSYIAAFIIFASRQQMDLVREDYYDQEIRFQQQIDRIKRTDPIMAIAAVNYDAKHGLMTITLPASAGREVSGTISFYRPSDAGLDQNVELAPDGAGAQTIRVGELRQGLWRVRVQWKSAGKEYFFEKPVVIRPVAAS